MFPSQRQDQWAHTQASYRARRGQACLFLQCASVGTRLEVIAMVQCLCDSHGVKHIITHGGRPFVSGIKVLHFVSLLRRAKASIPDIIEKYLIC